MPAGSTPGGARRLCASSTCCPSRSSRRHDQTGSRAWCRRTRGDFAGAGERSRFGMEQITGDGEVTACSRCPVGLASGVGERGRCPFVPRKRPAGAVLHVVGDAVERIWFIKAGAVLVTRSMDDEQAEGTPWAIRRAGELPRPRGAGAAGASRVGASADRRHPVQRAARRRRDLARKARHRVARPARCRAPLRSPRASTPGKRGRNRTAACRGVAPGPRHPGGIAPDHAAGARRAPGHAPRDTLSHAPVHRGTGRHPPDAEEDRDRRPGATAGHCAPTTRDLRRSGLTIVKTGADGR